MTYFNTREMAAIALFAALWGVLASFVAPIVFRATGLPILCDVVGFAILILAVWWIRKFGAVALVGITATIVNFIFNPGGFHFLGFTAASIIFDVIARMIGYRRSFKNPLSIVISMLFPSVFSAAIAGFIIGMFFTEASLLAKRGGVLGWVGLHAFGGVIGGLVGIILVTALVSRGFKRSGGSECQR